MTALAFVVAIGAGVLIGMLAGFAYYLREMCRNVEGTPR